MRFHGGVGGQGRNTQGRRVLANLMGFADTFALLGVLLVLGMVPVASLTIERRSASDGAPSRLPRSPMRASDEILFTRPGRILLNRSKALNTLTLGMCELLLARLQAWRVDPAVNAVVIAGAGEKAFCAGGDVVQLYTDHKAGGSLAREFWRTEYRCNTAIRHFGKPYVALMDGIVMGGGVGLSVHGSHRVVTDRTIFAMPETCIGLFPDVGGSYFLPRLPGAAGMYLGLTGARLNGPDCVSLGIAQALVPHGRLAELDAALADAGEVTEIINTFAQPVTDAPILAQRAAIDRHFSHESVAAILASLERDGGAWATAQLSALRKYSPLALKITFRQIRMGVGLSFNDCMRLEWRLASRMAQGHDFYEGVRALLVDKDNAPRWRPETLDAVSEAEVDAYFAKLPGDELDLSDIGDI